MTEPGEVGDSRRPRAAIWRKRLALTSALIATALLLWTYPASYLWLASGWIALSVAMWLFVARGFQRAVWFNIAFALIALCAFDLFLGREDEEGLVQTFSNRDFFGHGTDPVLGFAPPANAAVGSTVRFDGVLIYDVVYTTDANGLRVPPPAEHATECILFFGCSFMFGEGSNDEDTIPYRVGVESQGRYQVRNFAFSGYGPHQMLAAIESGRVEQAADCDPRYAVYLAIPDHALRAAGKRVFDTHGPRYMLTEQGDVTRVGTFADEAPVGALVRETESAVVALFAGRDEPYAPADGRLFRALLRAADR